MKNDDEDFEEYKKAFFATLKVELFITGLLTGLAIYIRFFH